MATTTYGVNDALAVKLWSRKLAVEVPKATPIAPLIGTSSNSIIVHKTETSKGPGDQITVGLRMQLRGRGVTEGQTQEGNEETLSTYSDQIVINELSHAVRVKNDGTIDTQRVPFDLRQEGKDGLVDWYGDRMSLAFFMQVCGYTAPSITFEGQVIQSGGVVYGFNAPTAPSAGRVIYAGSGNAADQDLSTGDVFDLTLIDKAVAVAKTANPKIRPVRVDGQDKYVMYLHPYQVHDLRINTSTGQWLDITKAVYSGAKASNPIYSGALGEYNGVILREAEHVVTGVSASNTEISTVRRAVLLGAQAGMVAFGQNKGPTSYKWVEELFDYKRELGIAVQTIWGLKKTRFNGVDFGTIVVPTYAASPA